MTHNSTPGGKTNLASNEVKHAIPASMHEIGGSSNKNALVNASAAHCRPLAVHLLIKPRFSAILVHLAVKKFVKIPQ